MAHSFTDIDKASVKRKLDNQEAELVEVPAKFTRKMEVDERIRAIEIDGEITPFLACNLCKSIYIWFKHDHSKNSWVNQSGLKSLKHHLTYSCTKLEPKEVQSKDIRNIMQAQKPVEKRKPLGLIKANTWKNFVVDLLASNPTVSISAHARIVSEVANFAASVTHSESSLFDFSIGRTQLTSHLVQRGKESQGKLEHIFNIATRRADFGVSGIIDYWSARHTHLIPYGAVMVCGLDHKFDWFCFPLRLETFGNEKKDARHTFDFFSNSVGGPSRKFVNPFFICSDNEAKMIAAFDGRYDTNGADLAGRVGCVEHALAICINDVFEKDAQNDLKLFIQQISKIETFYNKRPGLAKHLPLSIPEKSTTRPWRSYFNRFNSFVRNYSHYQLSGQPEVVDNLPPLNLCKSQLEIMKDTKYALDKLEVNGPTAHLSFMSYLTLDIKLYRKEVGIDEMFGFSNKTASHLRAVMGDKVWPYSGSSFSKTAAFFTGIDFYSKIKDVISYVEGDAGPLEIDTTAFIQSWLEEAHLFDSVAENGVKMMIRDLEFELDGGSRSTSQVRKVQSNDLFDSLFEPKIIKSITENYTNFDKQISYELERYKIQRLPTADVQSYWKNADFLLLRRAAQIFLSVPASSAAIERMFSEAGIILTKLRRRLDPGKLAALIYIKYASKYAHMCDGDKTCHSLETNPLGIFEFEIYEDDDVSHVTDSDYSD